MTFFETQCIFGRVQLFVCFLCACEQ